MKIRKIAAPNALLRKALASALSSLEPASFQSMPGFAMSPTTLLTAACTSATWKPLATLAWMVIVRLPSMRLRMPVVCSGLRETKFEIGTEPCAVSTRSWSSADSVRRSSGRRRRISTASSAPAGR